MDAKSPPPKALSLEPVETPPLAPLPAGDAPRPTSDDSSSGEKAKRNLRMSTTDEFLAEAAKEYQEGQIDQALWRRAADQGANDASLVVAAYLRARATALQLQRKHGDSTQGPSRRPGETRKESLYDGGSEPLPPDDADGTGFRYWARQPKYLAAAAAVLVAGIAALWLLSSPRQAVQPVAASAPTPATLPSAALPNPVVNAVDARPAFESRVQELKQAGNWNVLVLYASEWSRKEPNNATAWYELSVGYTKLHQIDDAIHAAERATQLMPADALLWSNLGRVNLAFERLPEAKLAFDRALALRADDPDSLCGEALIAQRQGRSGDANALVKAANVGCPGVSTATAVAR